MTYWQIFKGEYKNQYFYLYLFCWLPAICILIQSHTAWWVIALMVIQLPFVFPWAVLIENPHLRRKVKRRTARSTDDSPVSP